MGSSRVLMTLVLVFSGSLLLAEEASGPLSERTAAELANARTPEWISSFSEEVAGLQSNAPLSPSVFELVTGAFPTEWLPDDPREAARVVMEASRQTDTALRRGVPRALVREEIRAAWRTYLDSGQRVLLRLERRENRAADGSRERNRRSWEAQRHGKHGGWGSPRGMTGGDG